MTAMKKPLLTATMLFMAATAACAQAPDADGAAPAEAAASAVPARAKHRKPMHVESTQPKPKKHHLKKAHPPGPEASAA